QVPAMVMDHPGVQAMSSAFGGVEGIVGFPFFARYKMTIDYQALQMTFVPSGYEPTDATKAIVGMVLGGGNQEPKVLSPAAQWGMVLHKEAKDEDAGVVVKEVLPGGAAAAAGLKAGDRLLTLDDRWTDTLADAFLAATFVKAGQTTKLAVKRNGKEMELTVKPLAGFWYMLGGAFCMER